MRVAEAGPRDAAGDGIDAGALAAPARRRRGLEAVLVGATWLIGQLIFFRSQWTSGFNRAMGDTGAARFVIYVNENWYQALLGHASWKNPAFYYPLRNGLGLSDTFLLWQIVYAPARALGADPFLAYQLVLVALSAVGFVTFYLLTRVLWRPPIWLGLLGSALFTFPNALYANANHPQLFGILLVPAPLVLWVAAWHASGERRRIGIALGAIAGVLAVLVAYSTYYVAFFTAIAFGLVVIFSVLASPRTARATVVALRDGGWQAVTGAIAGAVLPALLFLDTFLPALHSAGGYHLAAAEFFAPSPPDLVNVGTGNLLWGSALVHGLLHGTAAGPERDYAVTPVLLLASLSAAVVATVVERRGSSPPSGRRYSAAVLAASGVVLLFLPMLVGSTFLWRAVYWIPGASGIRAIDRIGVVAAALMVLALVDAGTRLWPLAARMRPRRVLAVGAVALALVLCLEQINVSDSSQLSRRAQNAVLDAAPVPPAACKVFFVETTHTAAAHPARTQTTAMLLSLRYRIPTLNGTSGSFPAGWHLFYPTSGKPYLLAVRRWVAARHITSRVCALDLDTNTWTQLTTQGTASSR